jgi:galactokinase
MMPLVLAEMLESGNPEVDQYLGEQIYVSHDPEHLAKQRARLANTLRMHAERVGNKPTYILRAPGRLNAFLEYLDMCTGDHMSTTIDGDIPVAVSPREDDLLNVANFNPLFPADTLSLATEFGRFSKAPWGKHAEELEDNWDNRSLIYPYAGRPQGHWLNYVLSPYMRVMWDLRDTQLVGADMTFGQATAPFRAGTSSSSAIVVLSFLALYLCNSDKLPVWRMKDVCKLLGEAEWYVGTHGGANDQTTILSNPANCVLYNRHSKAELDSTPLPFLKGVHVVLANSLWEVNKTREGNQSFNMRKGWMQMGDELMKLVIAEVRKAQKEGLAEGDGWLSKLIKAKFGFTAGVKPVLLESRPDYWDKIELNYKRFGSLCEDIMGIPNEAITELVMLMPVKITPEDAGRILGKDSFSIKRTYTAPKRDIGGYHIRTTARFFLKENIIGRTLEKIFLEAEQRVASGELSIDSPEYDAYRVQVGRLVDDLQDALCFDFRVSIPQLDVLLTVARRGPGYLGGKLTGAGKGGCVSILVRTDYSAQMCQYLDENYYGKPELFEMYKQVLEDECRVCQPGTPEYDSAEERLQILESALANSETQRRVITFSRGACALELPGM